MSILGEIVRFMKHKATEEKIKFQKYRRTVNKSLIPTCNILGVNIAAIDMKWLLKYLDSHIKEIKGDYICVSNVHTTVTSYIDPEYCKVQNNGLMAIPDGGPLSSVAHKRGYRAMQRTTGPSLMGEIFKTSFEHGYRHFFYGSTQETLDLLKKNLVEDYPGIDIAGMYSPPFRPLTEEEDKNVIKMINETHPDFVWVGLGAPKQEIWMAEHQGLINGLMIGVGAGFDYYAGNIKRAPKWMQETNLEWFYRLMQDPKRLFKRYLSTNSRYIWDAYLLKKHDNDPKVTTGKPTVLIVHNYYKVPGGEDTVMANESKLLEEHGHKVVTYTRNNSELDHMSKVSAAFNTVFNIHTYKDIKRIIDEKNIDIVHVHNTLNIVSPAVYYAAKKKHVPVVQTIHNFRLLCPAATFYRDGHICEECVKKGLNCAIKYACYRDSVFQTMACVISDKIHRHHKIYSKINYICLTDFNKQKLLGLNQIKPEQIYVKPNFTMDPDITEIHQEREDQYIYVGRLDKLKGIRYILKAWKRLEEKGIESKLLVCGVGPEESWCRSFTAAYNLHNVTMKGFVPNNEVKKYIAVSKGLVFATQWYEGFPMTIAEAYSVGTPVLCSTLGNAGDLVVEGETGYKFKCDSADEIVEAVEKNNEEPLNYNAIAQRFRDKYSSEVNYKMLEGIYKNILGKRMH